MLRVRAARANEEMSIEYNEPESSLEYKAVSKSCSNNLNDSHNIRDSDCA